MSYLIETKDLGFGYNKKTTVFENLNFKLNSKEIVGIKGDSGCGKTTLCNLLCGIIPNVYQGIITGDILIDCKSTKDMTIAQISTNVGIVFQEAQNQFFAPTLEENLAFASENLKLDKDEIERRIVDALNLVNLTKYRYISPHKLSGGQMHLAALASLITLDPKVFILDEIMASLDLSSSELVIEIIKALKGMGKSIIIVEHNDNYLEICDRVLKYDNKHWEAL